MAEVFKARMKGEQGFEKIVAIKRIVPHMATNAEFVTMFVDEAKLAAQLNHNNITHIYDLGKVDAWHYIAMEYVEGKDLRTLLKLGKERGFPLPAELALFIAAKIANALDYAHRRPAPDGSELNLVHRDVSPQNILISDEGDIKLCDFGIAKAASKVSTTMSGALKGKLQYMSPEQAWGKRLDRRSDIFSLGSVLYEMLTGAPLFEGDTDMSVLESVREGEVAPPTSRGVEVPKRVDQIVLKALAKNPQERYQNASEFEKDLHAVLYTYQPSPGPADLAIYMHRLLEAHPGVRRRRSTPPSTRPATCPVRPRRRLPLPRFLRRKARASSLRRLPARSRGPSLPAPAPRSRAGGPPRRGREHGRARAARRGRVEKEPRRPRRRDRHRGGGARRRRALRDEGPLVGREAARRRRPRRRRRLRRRAASSAASVAPSPALPAAEPAKIVDPKAVEAEARRLAPSARRRCATRRPSSSRRPGSPRPRPRSLRPPWGSRP